MFAQWILIFYLAGYNIGGVGTIEFGNEAACQHALIELKKTMSLVFHSGICVPQTK